MFQELKQKHKARKWLSELERARTMPLDQLRELGQRAGELRGHLNDVISLADQRLGLPRIGSSQFPRPKKADWAWRPEPWRQVMHGIGVAGAESKAQLGNELTLFHDCDISELTFRQVRNARESDLAPFGMRMDVFAFDGSYLSLSLALPAEGAMGLRRNHLIRMNTIIEFEKPIEIFARLNVKHGPNTEHQLRELPLGADDVWVEFDLEYTEIVEKWVERMWIDLIFEGPQMNMVTIRDVTLARLPRAEIG
ncbi:MAG: DUF6478 family protein [Pseudomonadota bacterium]